MIEFSLKDVPIDGILDYCLHNWFLPVAEEYLKIDSSINIVAVGVSKYSGMNAIHTAIVPICKKDASIEYIERQINGDIFHYILNYERICKKLFNNNRGPSVDNDENYIKAMMPMCLKSDHFYDIYRTPIIIFSVNNNSIKIRNLCNAIKLLK